MDHWVRWAYDNAPGFVRAAVDWLVRFVTGVVGVVGNILHWTGVSWSRLYTGITAFGLEVRGFFGNTLLTLRWLRDIAIPRATRALSDALQRWARDQINRARTLLQAGIDALTRWARDQINRARDFIASVERWARQQLSTLLSGLNALGRALRHVLGGPSVLATWLAGAMLSALWRHVESNLDRYAATLWARRERLTLSTLSIVERLLTRIM